VSQYFTFTVHPLTTTSLVRGTRRWGLAAFTHSVDGVVMSTACSSTPHSGGRAFLGTIPGSLLDVSSRNAKSCRHSERGKRERNQQQSRVTQFLQQKKG
jgi:hypothetical protein